MHVPSPPTHPSCGAAALPACLQVMGVIVAEAPEAHQHDEFSQISRVGQSFNLVDQVTTVTKEELAGRQAAGGR